MTFIASFLPLKDRSRTLLLGTFAAACVLETFLVSLQAWRGVPSHFNVELVGSQHPLPSVSARARKAAPNVSGRPVRYDYPVPSTTIALGVALIIVGLAGYFLTGAVSLTALIPAAFGLVIALSGLIARDERRRKHAMHAAVVVALLGFLGSIRGLLQIGDVFDGTAARPAAIVAQTIMAVLTFGYIVIAVRSFVQARIVNRKL